MPKAYLTGNDKDNFGSYFLEDIADFLADLLDPDQIYEPDVLVKFVIDQYLNDVLHELSERGLINESEDGGFDES